MSLIPTWVTPPGTLGTIPEGIFYSIPLLATADSTVFYQVIAGRLPPGIFIDEVGVLSGNPAPTGASTTTVEGVPLNVTLDTTSKFTIRAYTTVDNTPTGAIKQLADRTFSLTISGQSTVSWITPAGNIATYIDGVQVTDLAVMYSDADIYAVNVVTLIAGALPPGLSISTSGIISGYITPDPTATVTSENYSFTLRVSNATTSDVRTFSILVYARNLITADNTYITADNTYITADTYPLTPPIITTPTGSIGSTRSDNFYAFQFTGEDFSGNAFEFIAVSSLPPGLTLDPNTGWLYGYIPYGGVTDTNYTFDLIVREKANHSNYSIVYPFSLTITGPVNSDVVWITPDNLGTIDNGSISTFNVEAVNVSGTPLLYQLVSGSDSRLPQGLQLLSSGNIAGRVSFDTFALDGGTTTFDVGLNTVKQPTTFDMVATFTVNAYSVNGLVNVSHTFSITVVRRYQTPYDNLYIQAMPPESDRAVINGLLQDSNIFPPELIYRNDDPYFGVASRIVYEHAYGLTPVTIDEYFSSLQLNHYWKNLTLGEIKTAQALDDNGNVLYEVVYSEVVDNLVNNDGVSVGKDVPLPYAINPNTIDQINVVYPNSLEDMRTQVIDVVGQVSNVLPRWMLSRQKDGGVLGFTPAWVIAYTNPGQSGQIAYNIQTQFSETLNLIDFEADRYELDNSLTKNWDRDQQHWGYSGDAVTPYPASLTTFDLIGVPPFSPTTAYQVGQVVEYQTVVNEVTIAKVYVCIQATTPGILPTDSAYWNSNGVNGAAWQNNANVITTWEDNLETLATWTYATPPGTTFDGNSMLFTAPVDMYATNNTTDFDRYLLFPKRNIITDLPQEGSKIIPISWFNTYGEFVQWLNYNNETVAWINSV